MKQERIEELANFYKRALLDDVVPFWLNHSLDREYGGYLHFLDRDGTIFGTDKSIWMEGRETWLFSRLYNSVEQKKEWLDAAKLGRDFIMNHGFDQDGRMFLLLTRDGLPLRKHRYLFAECFGVMGLAEYSRASGDQEALQKAKDTYKLVVQLYRTRDYAGLANYGITPKVIPETRTTKSLAMPMMLICISQELRRLGPDPLYDETIDLSIHEILRDFMKPNKNVLLETVGLNGEMFLDLPEGRLINPGHDIEVAWFLMHEGLHRKDNSLIDSALQIIDWSLEWGWDKKYGGLLYFVDIGGKPPGMLEWDMKLWWPHNEALYALLLANHITGEDKYLVWYEKVHEWAFNHFPDPEYGEWFGYLHRDGTVSLSLKGSMWKGAFHLPRCLLFCWKLLEKMKDQVEYDPCAES